MRALVPRALPVLVALWLSGCGSAALTTGADLAPGSTSPKTFACGPSQCDAATEYCYETFTCIATEGFDLGDGRGYACTPIPTQCESKSNACGCTLESLGGSDDPGNEIGGIDTAPDGAPGGCTIASNCV